jgi:septum formation protein
VTPLVLASASAIRARLLEAAGVAFIVRPANIDEDALKTPGADPVKVASALAERKALAVPGELVLGADQVAVCDGRLLSKPSSLAAAREQLRFLRGKPHVLISALALAKDGAVVWRHTDEARLVMRDFSDRFLEAYLAADPETLSSVGGYRLENPGAQLFARIEGDYFSILGLPLLPLLAALRDQGVIGR